MKRILVVEDDESQRMLYRDELIDDGYDVLLASNGKEALDYLEKNQFDLVILDIVMPKMDGMETLGRIIRTYRDVPIILHTAYSSYRDDFLCWGAEAFVIKSHDLGELKSKIQEVLATFNGV